MKKLPFFVFPQLWGFHFKSRSPIESKLTVDGISPAFSFGVIHNFQIIFLRFRWRGKFILAINIFRTFLRYVKNISVKYQPLE